MPLSRFIDIEQNLDLLANGITFSRASARDLIEKFLSRNCCGGGDCCDGALSPRTAVRGLGGAIEIATTPNTTLNNDIATLAQSFFTRALAQDLSPADVFRITITSFMDAFNFDIRALMRSCVHHVLPTGHIIPFDAYNLLYRPGHVALPPLNDQKALAERFG